jgi:hypothetical protein
MAGEYSDEELEKILDKVSEWSRVFSESQHYANLTEEQKEESGFIISTFTEYMYSYHGSRPDEWDEIDLRACCLDTLPRKITVDEPYYRSIAPVLSAFFTFLEAEGLLKGIAHLAKTVKEIDNRIVEKSNDPLNWGVAKSLMMSAKRSGVNIQDKREVEAFLLDMQKRQLASLTEKRKRPDAAPEAIVEHKPKVGRNEPCPCGSGKKYKKCCGQ